MVPRRALPQIFSKKIASEIKPPKKNLANFPTQKNPRMENFKPKKILWFQVLKSRVPPYLPPPAQGLVITKASTLLFMVAQRMKEN